MIPKGGGANFRGIVLVKVLWKAISGIINRQLLSSIQFYDVLREFCAGRGMGTATLKVKLLQNLITMRETILHAIFLYLRKAYDALDREICLDILAGYGLGPRTIRILRTYWSRVHMASKVGETLWAHLTEPPRGNSGGPPVTHDL